MTEDQDTIYMRAALEEAKKAYGNDEVPVGAVLVDPRRHQVIARSSNTTITDSDPTAHAEIAVIREGCHIDGKQRIPDYDLYVTLEPCTMCAGAISFARIRRLVFGAPDPKGGAVTNGIRFFEQPTCHHKPAIISGIMEKECGSILKDFFVEKRKK